MLRTPAITTLRLFTLGLLTLTACSRGTLPATLTEDEALTFSSLETPEAASKLQSESTFPFPFVRIGLLWDADNAHPVDVRFREQDGAWSEWIAPTVVWAEGLAHAGYVDTVGSPHSLQLRLRGGSPVPTHLRVEPIESLGEDAPGGEPEALLTSPFPSPKSGVGTLSQGLAAFPPINSRASWNARPPTCIVPMTPYRSVIHHTAGVTNDTMAVEARLRQLQAYDLDVHQYCDVMYNYFVSRDARVWEGRGATVRGGATKNANEGQVAICYLGTYVSDLPTTAQLCSGSGMFAWLNAKYGVALNPTVLKGHRDYVPTACPGDQIYNRLPAMITNATSGCGATPTKPTNPTEPIYAAQLTAKAFPNFDLATNTLTLLPGQGVTGTLQFKNTGTAIWKAGSVKLAPTPRDQPSVLATDDWLSPSRVSTITADVPPGAVGTFKLPVFATFSATTQTFTLLAELVTWFGDQGGPADNAFTLTLKVAVPLEDGGIPPLEPDAGTEPDPEADAGETEHEVPQEVDAGTGPVPSIPEGCGCSGTGSVLLPFVGLLLAASLGKRGRTNRPRR